MKTERCLNTSRMALAKPAWPALRDLKIWLGLFALLGFNFPAHGLGSRIPNQDPDAIARGNAFVATADNPSAIYYNPAGISQLDGTQIHVGSLFYLNIYADYDSPSGQRTKNITEVIPVPELHLTYALKSA